MLQPVQTFSGTCSRNAALKSAPSSFWKDGLILRMWSLLMLHSYCPYLLSAPLSFLLEVWDEEVSQTITVFLKKPLFHSTHHISPTGDKTSIVWNENVTCTSSTKPKNDNIVEFLWSSIMAIRYWIFSSASTIICFCYNEVLHFLGMAWPNQSTSYQKKTLISWWQKYVQTRYGNSYKPVASRT